MMVQEVRCKKCGKLLCKINNSMRGHFRDKTLKTEEEHREAFLKGEIDYEPAQYSIEIKCPRCGEMNVRKENVEDGNRFRNRLHKGTIY